MALPGTPNAISLRDIQTEFGGPDGTGQWAVSAMPSNSNWNAVAFGNNTFVAIADSTQAATSPNGTTWTARTIVNANWRSLAFGNGVFVATPNSSAIAATSPDGITWTQRTLPSSGIWNVVFGGGVFLAYTYGAAPTTMAVSTDGATWTTVSFPTSPSVRAVAYGAGLFVAFGYNTNTVYTSPDGVSWTARTLPTTGTWQVVQYGGDRFVCLSQITLLNISGGPFIGGSLTSPDGITWTYYPTPSGWPSGGRAWQGLVYGDGVFVAQAGARDAAKPQLSTFFSSDGITWTPKAQFTPSVGSRTSIAFGNNTFVSVGQQAPAATYNIAATSSLPPYYVGSNWVTTSIPTAGWWLLAFGNNTFVAITQSGTTYATSTDGGVTWTSRTLPLSTTFWSSIKFGGGLFMLVGGLSTGANAYLSSPDGITWTVRSLPTSTGAWRSIVFGNGQFVAVSSGTSAATSPDGINWTSRTMPTGCGGDAAIYANGVYLTLTSSGTGAISSNGINWTALSIPSAQNYREIAFGNGLFVASSSGFNSINSAVSNDGVNWALLETPNRSMTNVAFGGGVFAMTPFNNFTYSATSLDGITWTTGRTTPLNGWAACAYGNNRFVAVAFQGSNPRSMYLELGSNICTPPGSLGFPSGTRTTIPAAGTVSINNFNSAGVFYLDCIVVGGGGGGGPGWLDSLAGGGGGGGGGGVAIQSGIPFVLADFSGSASVGVGGVGVSYPDNPSSSGGSSRLTLFSSYDYTSLIIDGGGGGGGRSDTTPTGGAGGSPGGNAGGAAGGGAGGSNGAFAGGGGGGIDNSAPTGTGGNGVLWPLNNTYYGGGGGGGGTLAGTSTGGLGGGGAGASNGAGQNGTNGRGGGGGGGGSNSLGKGGDGGSGVIIISYASSIQLLSGGTVTSSGGRFFHTFTTVGSNAITVL